jgi:adenine phosphoribosyltransferase
MLQLSLQNKILELYKKEYIYSIWSDKDLFKTIIDELSRPFRDSKIDKVLGLESRGFILGAPVAYLLNAGFVVARKQGKLYHDYNGKSIYSESLVDYSGKLKALEIEAGEAGIQKGDTILIVDDWFETGAQGHAAIKLVEKAGGVVAGISIMFNDMNKNVYDSFSAYRLNTLVLKIGN